MALARYRQSCWTCSVAPAGDRAWLGTRQLSRHVLTKRLWYDVGYVSHSRPQALLAGCGRGPAPAGCRIAAVRHGARACAQAVLWLGQHYQLAGMLSVGFAGGLQAELSPGDALLVTHILAQDDVARTASPAAGSGIRPDARLAHMRQWP